MTKLHSKVIGNNAEELVQNKLWNFNYKARRTPKGKFDLVVDDNIKLEVKSATLKGVSWNFSWGSTTPKDRYADVYAFVFYYPDQTYKIGYIKSEDLIKLMEENGSVWSVSFRSPLDEALESSPYKVFGYPQFSIKGD